MPTFGRTMLEHWALEPETLYLNHGTVGATPRRVLAAQQAIRDEMERQPARFLFRELTPILRAPAGHGPRLREAADAVAAFVGVRGSDLVFVDNATAGVNAVVQSLPLGAGDEILLTDHGYGSVATMAAFVARPRGAHVRTVPLPDAGLGPAAFVEAFDQALTARTRLAIVDHVVSANGLVLPVAAMVACARRRGVPVLVDGAHAPGSIALDVPALGADWYVANLHKWAFAPRGCGFLWAHADRQSDLRPPVLSWGLGRGFLEEFDLIATYDPSARLAAPAGIAFLRELGLDAVLGWNHSLAMRAAKLLSARWDVPFAADESMVGTMVAVQLPARAGSKPEDAMRLRDALLFEDRIEVHVQPWRDRVWLRVSAQVYNDLADIERLADAVAARL